MKKPDCRTCGLCCTSPYEQDVFVDLTGGDLKRLGPYLTRKYVLGPDTVTMLLQAIDGHVHDYSALITKSRIQRAGPYKGLTVCCCAFLRGSVLNQVSCRIYERRPKACREAIRPGDGTCKALRMEALRWLQR